MGSSAPQYPIALKAVPGSHSLDHVRNAVASLGDAAGPWPQPGDWVPVDVLFPQTLILLAGQGSPAVASGRDSKPSAVAGGVWVREQITVHGPMRIGEAFEVSGEIVRSYSRKGRLYSVSCSTTRNAAGERLVTNRTTGLVRYRPDPAIADAEQGLAETELGEIAADWDAAAGNPCASALRSARVSSAVRAETVRVSSSFWRRTCARSRWLRMFTPASAAIRNNRRRSFLSRFSRAPCT